MPQNVSLVCRGLYTFPNVLSQVPDGALIEANNVVIDRDSVVNPRRGVQIYGNSIGTESTNTADQLLVYKYRVLRFWGNNLDVDSDGLGTFTNIGTNIVPPAQERIKGIEANGNFYFTSNSGIKKISSLTSDEIATTTITNAGGIAALDLTATLDYTEGFFTQDSAVAYSVVWGIQDANKNVILGVPSTITTIYNSELSLLIRDFNKLLIELDTTAALGGSSYSDTDYSDLTIPPNSNGTTLSAAIESLADKLDSDFTGFVFENIIGIFGISAISAANPSIITSNNHGLNTGDGIIISGSNSTPSVDGLWTITKIDSNSFSIPINVTVAGTTGTFTSSTITTPVEPYTNGEINTLQGQYDSIVNTLNSYIGAISPPMINGSAPLFSNSTQSTDVNLSFLIPAGITTAYFYQIYRGPLQTATSTQVLATDVFPSYELNQIYEGNPTTAQLSAGVINFVDNVPDSFRANGAYLYTNANSGEGIDQANNAPPNALDIAFFKGSTFYANTSTNQLFLLNLLASDSALNNQYFVIGRGATSNIYQFVPTIDQAITITTMDGSQFTQAGAADYFDIYSANNAVLYRFWFSIGSATAPAAPVAPGVLVPVVILNADTADQVATKLVSAFRPYTDFILSAISGDTFVATNASGGYTNAPVPFIAYYNPPNASGFNLTVSVVGSGELIGSKLIGISANPDFAIALDETARSITRVINGNSSEIVSATYTSGATDTPGGMAFTDKTLGSGPFFVMSSASISNKFSPTLGGYNEIITAIGIGSPTHITSVAHGLSTGNTIQIINSNSTPNIDGIYTITKIDVDTFSIPVNVTVAGTTGEFASISVLLGSNQASSNDVSPNRIFFSKYQLPEAVPSLNYLDVGPKDQAILRILPLRDSLFIMTEGAVWRISGDNASDFQLYLFDASTLIKAPDTAAVLNNQIYMFSNQGVATISDTGVSVISRPIEDQLLPLLNQSNFNAASFGVTYESDRAYILWVTTLPTDTVATQAFRYNTFTSTWVRWPIAKTCGIVNTGTNLLYLGAADINNIEVERKSFSRLDYADRQYDHSFPSGSINGTSLTLGSIFEATVGDAIVQTQYLTIAQFNRLLQRLDTDGSIPIIHRTYYNTLKASTGDDLSVKLTALVNKLNIEGDTSGGYTSSGSNVFTTLQADFNTIVDQLNLDVKLSYHLHKTSNGTVGWEVTIVAIDSFRNIITIAYAQPFIVGDFLLYKHIDSDIIWATHHLGDPSMLKHISESTILFNTFNFTEAIASYSSDLSPSLEEIPFPGEGPGFWSGFSWGESNWGGVATNKPFRTLVPRNKQRCRYISGKFEHATALESYGILGISYTFNMISSRGYR